MGGEVLLPALGFEEGVEGIADCRLPMADGWDGRLGWGLERPVFARVGLGLFVLRGAGAGGNPLAQRGDLRGVERFALGRHPLVEAVGGDFLQQQTGVGFASDKGGAVLAALADELGCVEAQLGLLLECAVAGVTARGEDGFYFFEIIHSLGGPGGEAKANERNESGAEHGVSDGATRGFIARGFATSAPLGSVVASWLANARLSGEGAAFTFTATRASPPRVTLPCPSLLGAPPDFLRRPLFDVRGQRPAVAEGVSSTEPERSP